MERRFASWVFLSATVSAIAYQSCEAQAPCTVLDHYPPPAGMPGSDAVPADDPRIVAWATGWVEPVDWGLGLAPEWKVPSRAIGPASTDASGVVSLGAGGSITMTFDVPITDGLGPDLAVFENGFSDTFLEFAFVEVSTDGDAFARFPAVYLGDEPVGPFGGVDPALAGGVAGRYRAGFGTPFDLDELEDEPVVASGEVDLKNVVYVRIVDVVGDGSVMDCRGRPIFDPYPTSGSAGFDLDAVAVMNSGD